jgi:hypothetical protein
MLRHIYINKKIKLNLKRRIKMTSSKKNSKSIIALVVMSFLLVASIVLAATGAWFTSVARQHSSLTFGTVTIDSLTPGTDGLVSATSRTDYNFTDEYLMPGDTLEVNFDVDYAGTVDAYMVAKIDVTINTDATGSSAITGLTGWYAIRDLVDGDSGTLSLTTALTTNGSAGVVSASTASSDVIPVNIQVELPGATYGDVFEGKVISVKVSLYAIQRENLTAQEAYKYIVDNSGDLTSGDTGYSSTNDDLNVHLADNQTKPTITGA